MATRREQQRNLCVRLSMEKWNLVTCFSNGLTSDLAPAEHERTETRRNNIVETVTINSMAPRLGQRTVTLALTDQTYDEQGARVTTKISYPSRGVLMHYTMTHANLDYILREMQDFEMDEQSDAVVSSSG